MWVDNRFQFADAQTLSPSDGATALTDHYDVGGDFDLGPGETLYWVVSMDVSPGDELTFALQTDDNSGFSSATQIASLVFAEGVAAGTKLFVGFPATNERFIRVLVTPTADDGTSTFSSWVTSQHPSATQAYPDNVPT